ncbi:MerR family transcriptional regulator [Kineococcus sp. SYSU DK006]|uniref:MerR family transcriptional regulator n=1 Tax=Kineococcus sp. SYSU DK006 TaxID=3383127 RepID=UPI003D7E14C4
MEWTISEVARAAGTTSRTLRHYGDVGLLAPSRTGPNGYRYYDDAALRRLQRIMLLRELGMGLPAIRDVLEARTDEVSALRAHLDLLRAEAARTARLVESVRTTLERTQRGEELDVEQVFDGFDHGRHEEEVVQRWGREAADGVRRAWESLGERGREAHAAEHAALARALADAAARGDDAGAPHVQELVRRHHAWVSLFWTPSAEAYRALTRGYVDDERFRAAYDAAGPGTARYLHEAADVFAGRSLS